MLSFLSTQSTTDARPKYWDAPDHFKVQRGPRSNAELERELAEQRHRALRYVGMW